MKRVIYIGIVLAFLSSCNNSTEERFSGSLIENNPLELPESKDSFVNIDVEQDSFNLSPQIKTIDTLKKIQKKNELKSPSPTRFVEFPGDDNFNGKPLIQQVEISQKMLEKFPDTLKNLAISRYKTYEQYFPITIADNFDDGISTEIISFPEKLIFTFQLFEDEFSSKPYLIKDVVIKRNEKGELYAE